MKMLKRFFSVLLFAAMLFTAAVPAFANDIVPSDSNFIPVISQQPHDVVIEWEMRDKTHFSGIVATVPEGKLGYRLYCGDELYNDDPIISYQFSYDDVPGEYYFEVYNIDHPEYSVKSESFTVSIVEPTFGERIVGFFEAAFQFLQKCCMTVMGAAMSPLLSFIASLL